MKFSLLKEIQQLNEVKMNIGELNKLNSATNIHRIDILLKRIKDKQPIKLTSGKDITIDPKSKLTKAFVKAIKTKDDDDIAKVVKAGTKFIPAFDDTDGNSHTISNLEKADYFGGGGGSKKATAKTTAQGEAMQAIGFALLYNSKKNKPENVTIEKANAVKGKKFDVGVSVDSAFEKYQGDWIKSTINTVEAFQKKYGIVKNATFQHGSAWTKSLTDEFNKLNRQGGKLFSQKDKWNPADIWLVTSSIASKSVPSFDNLVELNAWLEEMFEKKKVIGISLKFSPKGTKTKEFNNDKEIDDLLDVTIKELMVSKTGKMFRSNSGHIMFENALPSVAEILNEADTQEMIVRTFGSKDDTSGEITGKYAAGGKVSFTEMKKILSRLAPRKAKELKVRNAILKARDPDKKAHTDKKKEYGYTAIIDDIIAMADIVNPSIAKEADTPKSRAAFAEKVKSKPNHIISKYQSVQLLSFLKNMPKKKAGQFIQSAVMYASSQHELSSVFVKVW